LVKTKKCKKCNKPAKSRGLCNTHYYQWWSKHMYEKNMKKKKTKKKKDKWNINLFKVRNAEYTVENFKMEFGFPDLDDLNIKDPKELLLEPLIELKRFSIDIKIKKKKSR